MGGRYSSIISPPDRVAIERHVPSCMSFLTKRTPPSQKRTFTPPACPLRALINPFCCCTFMQSHTPSAFGGK